MRTSKFSLPRRRYEAVACRADLGSLSMTDEAKKLLCFTVSQRTPFRFLRGGESLQWAPCAGAAGVPERR
jgi:hypothetical protein